MITEIHHRKMYLGKLWLRLVCPQPESLPSGHPSFPFLRPHPHDFITSNLRGSLNLLRFYFVFAISFQVDSGHE